MSRAKMQAAIQAKQAEAIAKAEAEREAKARAESEKKAEEAKARAEKKPREKDHQLSRKKDWGTRRDWRMGMEQPTKSRLPDRSQFQAVYDAETMRWFGTLKLACGKEFGADSGAVMKLLRKLDDLYREWVETEEANSAKG